MWGNAPSLPGRGGREGTGTARTDCTLQMQNLLPRRRKHLTSTINITRTQKQGHLKSNALTMFPQFPGVLANVVPCKSSLDYQHKTVIFLRLNRGFFLLKNKMSQECYNDVSQERIK